jgi:hypothetical protein
MTEWMDDEEYRIPDLQLDLLVFDANGSNAKLHTNSQLMVLDELLICELKKNTTLSNSYARSATSKSH